MDPRDTESFTDIEAEEFKHSSDPAPDGRSQPHAGDGASPGKIFIGGLARETTTAQFVKHFSSYGEIIDSVIMRDRKTGQPRGFGFVTYADPFVVDKVIEDTHIINGKQVEIKRTIPKGAGGPNDFKTKKIFVGGIPGNLTEDEFKDFFSQFGEVKDHQIMKDHSTSRSRGFGFITFETEQAVDELLAQGNRLELAGSQVEVKKAEPKRPNAPPPSSRRFSGSRSSYGGGFGNSFGSYGDGGSGVGGYRSGGGAYGGRAAAYGGYGRGSEFDGGYGGYGGGEMGGPYRGGPSLGYSSHYGGGLNQGYYFGGSYDGSGDGYGGYGSSSGGRYGEGSGVGGYGEGGGGGYGGGSGGGYGRGRGRGYGGGYDPGFEGSGSYGGGGGSSFYGGRGGSYGGGGSSAFGGSGGSSGRYHPYGR